MCPYLHDPVIRTDVCILLLVASTASADQYGRGYKYDATHAAASLEASARVASPSYQHQGSAPASVDWRTKGAVSPVRDQGQGETCWAFSTAGSVEGAMVAVGGAKAVAPTSPQYLIDCMGIPCANSSGTPDNAFAWISNHQNGEM